MKIIELKNSNLKTIVDDEDYMEYNNITWSFHKALGVYSSRKTICYLHRLIMNAPKGLVVDHIDGNKLNNQKNNLRICTQGNNSKNQKKPKNNSSGYKGVMLDSWAVSQNLKKKWIARIKVNRKGINLGRYLTKIEAAIAYNKAAEFYYGEYANLNIITKDV